MTLQMLVHNTLAPKRSLLTFRLPWRAGKTDYLKGARMHARVRACAMERWGRLSPNFSFTALLFPSLGELRFPVWSAITTTECRLVPTKGITLYDHKKYVHDGVDACMRAAV